MPIPMEQAARELDQFDSVIDVRSPSEWALDHLPGAINTPALSDAQRAEIGTLYKQSSFEAKKRGAALVARNIAQALEQTFADRPRSWRPLVYCWRGGNRSNAFATVMHRIGWRVSVLQGGYAAYRKFLIQDLERCAQSLNFTVVCGVTGSGKSVYLRALAAQGEQVLDLEALAHHRGSLLGHEPVGQQPSQKAFESQIWNVLRHCSPDRTVWVESESKKIGSVQVPDALIGRMRESICLELAPAIAERVAFLCQEYAHFFTTPEMLIGQLSRLKALVGGQRLAQWIALINAQRWPELVRDLLVHHYDPSYSASMLRNYRHYASAEQITTHPAMMPAAAFTDDRF